jgi:chromosome segregation ATPase
LDLAINEKKQTIEELNKLKIQIDTIKKENEALSKEKASSSNEFTEFKNKLNEKSNKIKFLEEKIVELTTNNTSSKASLESMNKKITEFENKIISLNKEKNEITIKCENDIKLLKAAQGKELENCKTSYEKDCSLLKMKFENELESVKNNFSKQIETNNSKNKSLDEKYANLPQFISNLFSFYEENDGMISINQTKMTSILERFNEIKSNFGLLETTISEVSVDDNSNINKNKIRIYNKLDDASEKVEHLIEKCKNFEKVKEKIESILTRSDEIISKTGLNFVNLDKVKKKLIKSNKKAYIRKQ